MKVQSIELLSISQGIRARDRKMKNKVLSDLETLIIWAILTTKNLQLVKFLLITETNYPKEAAILPLMIYRRNPAMLKITVFYPRIMTGGILMMTIVIAKIHWLITEMIHLRLLERKTIQVLILKKTTKGRA